MVNLNKYVLQCEILEMAIREVNQLLPHANMLLKLTLYTQM